MSLETLVSAAEDRLIDGLSFQGRPTASYITRRDEVTLWPVHNSPLSPTGTKAIRFHLNDQGILDGSTLRLVFTFTNKRQTGDLVPITSSPISMFRRWRLLAGNQTIEDIDQYGRVAEMSPLGARPSSRAWP